MSLVEFDAVLQQNCRVYESGFVPQELRTLFKAVFKVVPGELFEVIIAIKIYGVPYFLGSSVQVIDRVKVQVLFVPTKQWPPHSHI